MMSEPVGIVFFPTHPGPTPAIRAWQAHNPDWRAAIQAPIVCPVCGLEVSGIADLALLSPVEVEAAIVEFREHHLRAACSDHYLPTLEYWARVESSKALSEA